jgi:hypothetical protein
LQTLISFDPILPGLGLPIDLRRLQTERRVEPGSGIGIRVIRSVPPRDLLQSFLSTSFDDPRSTKSFLQTFGIPVRAYGIDEDAPQYQTVAVFEELAELAGSAVSGGELAGLRRRFAAAFGHRSDFYSISELQELQERMRRRAQPMLDAAISKQLFEDAASEFAYLNLGLAGTRLQVRVKVVDVDGVPTRTITLSAADYYEFEPALWLGVLQCVIERRPIRPCHQCGRYFSMNERRGDHRFCNRSCKQRWANDQRRLRRTG